MSFDKAKTILSDFTWHHIGFAFFWASAFVIGSSYTASALSDEFAYTILKLATTCIALAIGAYAGRHLSSFPPHSVFISALSLSCGSLLYYLDSTLLPQSSLAGIVSSILVGASVGFFYLAWQGFFVSEGRSRSTIFICSSAILAVILCIVLRFCGVYIAIVANVIILPALSAYSLFVCLRKVEDRNIAKFDRKEARKLVKSLWKPVLCVCVIGFAWRVVTSVVVDPASVTFFVGMMGMLLAAAVVIAIELFNESGFEVLRVYQLVFPLVTGIFLLPLILGDGWLLAASASAMFGFEIVNLILVITLAVYAGKCSLNPMIVYAVGIVPEQLSIVTGDLVARHVATQSALGVALVPTVLLVCVYAFAIAMFLASWHREGGSKKKHDTEIGVTPSEIRNNSVEHELAIRSDLPDSPVLKALSPREREIVLLVVRGHTVAAIAEKLFISENTVRGHMKRIYRKLDIHAKQELIDLLGL